MAADWHSAAIGAVVSSIPGRRGRSEILPRRPDGRGGASVVRCRPQQRHTERVVQQRPRTKLLNSFAPTPVHGAIGHRGASDIERTRGSRIGKPFVEQRTHSSLERFAKTDGVLA
jgi:hypothetical protein